MEKVLNVGIDVGSTTVKIVIIDNNKTLSNFFIHITYLSIWYQKKYI